MDLLFTLIGAIVGLVGFAAAVASYKEGEPRAARLFVALGFATIGTTALIWTLSRAFPWIGPTALALVLVIFLVFWLPVDPARRRVALPGAPARRVDERDIIFARWRLQPGSERFELYYQQHPELADKDRVWRQRPGLLSHEAPTYHPMWFAAIEATFDLIEDLHPYVRGDTPDKRIDLDPAALKDFLRDWLLRSGAHSVGVTRLRPYHVYTHRGRTEPYGEPIALRHRTAIAFTVEMNRDMVRAAPLAPIVLESADQYLRSGVMALKVARMLRYLGYDARAHIDGNYEVICPLVARDAGLGEIGRMGLLITPRLGPRVRIAVVTTDAPLPPDEPLPDPTVIDFCNRCRKCADNCPARAIPSGAREGDPLRWKIDAEACFTYWCTVGTDCGRCVRVCPYSHSDTWLHRLVRHGIERSFPFRLLALRLDDVFYGAHPDVRAPSSLQQRRLSAVDPNRRSNTHGPV